MNLRILLFCLLFPCLCVAATPPAIPQKVEVVFCLDLSASTNGLVERIRDHLWDYTGLFLDCSPQPTFRIGIVGFSRMSFKRETGYVKVLKDLTGDIEAVGKELYDMKTSIEKGDQFVGHALNACAHSISWTRDDPSVLKIIILAGNGDTQTGGIDPRTAVAELQNIGVDVNVLYCMPRVYSRREVSGWEELARLGKGTFQTFSVSTRYYAAMGDFDMERLRNLNDSLNATYLFYGTAGKTRWQWLTELDHKVLYANPEGFLQRSRFKCSSLFQGKNSSWDLVDLLQVRSATDYRSLEAALLPESLQPMAAEERQQRVLKARQDRYRYLSEMQVLLRQWKTKTDAGDDKEKTIPSFDVLACKIIADLLEKNGYVCRPVKN